MWKCIMITLKIYHDIQMFWWKIFKKLEKIVLHLFFHEKIQTPHCGFTLSQRILIWTNLEIHYQPPHKFWLFGPNGLREEEFTKQWFLLFFKFLIIFPSKRTRLIRITRHAVNQGSKFGKNKNSKKNGLVQDFRGNEN